MGHDIEAIFLDVGNTLRTLVPDEAFAALARQRLVTLAGAGRRPRFFFEDVKERWKAYRKWSRTTLIECSDAELWTRWLLPDRPPEEVAPIAGALTRLWRDTDGRRVPRPDARSTLIGLSRRGYLPGSGAHVVPETEIP